MAAWKIPPIISRKSLKSSVSELFFPTFCLLCDSRAEKIVCPICVDALVPIHPSHRCTHCFQPHTAPAGLCRRCHYPTLDVPRSWLLEPTAPTRRILSHLEHAETLIPSLAALFVLQWGQLNWPLPTRVISLPSTKHIDTLAHETARLLHVPYSNELHTRWIAPFQHTFCRWRKDNLDTHTILLLDIKSSSDTLKHALSAFWPSFPEDIRILSLTNEEME